MEQFLYIGSILSMAIMSLISDLNEKSGKSESFHDSEYVDLQDTSRNKLLIKVDSFYLDIISPSLGVQFYKDGIVFLASTKNTVKMIPGHISFGTSELFVAIPGDSTIGKATLFSSDTLFSYPCDALTFSDDFKTMYFTRYSKTNGKEKIYQAVLSSGKNMQPIWSEKSEPLVFCNDNYNYSHPALSVNGESMVFASNRKGSLGGMDLFISKKEGESWSVPQNMGNEINTKGNELFPYLDSNNNLFFSSDGLPGLGGYDIFTCKFNGKTWDKPLNLTKLINSGSDELAFTINKNDGKSGFFTSRQKSNKMVKQLFKVTLNNNYIVDNSQILTDVLFNNVLQISDLTAMKSTDSTVLSRSVLSENKKEVKPAEIPVKTKEVPKSEVKAPEIKVKAKTEVAVSPEVKKQAVIYRIQFAATVNSKGSYKMTVDNKIYNTYEYIYKGAYRSTVGEFRTLSEAKAFQNTLRRSGYPGAFVAAFVNNVRSLDPALFK